MSARYTRPGGLVEQKISCKLIPISERWSENFFLCDRGLQSTFVR